MQSRRLLKSLTLKNLNIWKRKKKRNQEKKTKNVGVKEIRLSPFIGSHDFQTRLTRAQEFLKQGNQLKISVPFRGREITKKEFGMETIKRAISQLSLIGKLIKEPYFEGRVLSAILVPLKGV